MEKSFLPLISVIIPSFNEEKHIERCIESVVNQTYKNIEIICVDDNSTDNTVSIIKKYQSKFENIKLLKNQQKGVSSARNYGIENASGEYIGFVDSDDFIQPQMYEFLLRAINENSLDMAACRYSKTSEFIPEKFEYKARKCTCDEFINLYDMDFVKQNELVVTAVWSKLIKRDLLKNLKFENYRIGEDTVFCSKLWTSTKDVYFVDLPLYCYFVNTESVSYTELWHEKWFDLLETRFISYENFKNYPSSMISSFYLDRGMKFILSYRFNLKGTENEQKFKVPLKKYFKKYIGEYFKCSDINIKYKISIALFYFLPFLYKAYRKKLDNTL